MSLLKKLALLGIVAAVVLAAGAAEAAPGKSSNAKPTGESAPATPDLVPWTCVPSCTGGTETNGSPSVIDGRMIGTTGDFANFSLLGELSDPKSVLVMRIFTDGNGDPGNLQVGIFDPDHRGLRLGKVGGGAALWDVDRDVNRQPSTVPLRYKLCVEDPGNEFSCLGAPIQEETSTGLAAYDNRWFQFNPITLTTADEFHLLEISVDTLSTDPEVIRDILASGWNMFKVRARAVTGSGIKSPITVFVPGYIGEEDRAQVLGFGVPMVSIAEAEVLYPSFDFSDFENPANDLSDTTYDGTWTFPAVNNPSYVTATDPSVKLTIYDGDWDFGRADHPDGTLDVCTGLDPGDFDTNDDDSPDLPDPFLEAIGCGPADPTCSQAFVTAAAGLVGLQAESTGLEIQVGSCRSLSAPPDDWPESLYAGGYFFRRVPSDPDLNDRNLGYVVLDRLNTRYVNDNPSGNQEFEKFEISTEAGCSSTTSDFCVSALETGLYRLKVEGLDVLNLNHWIAPLCYNGNTDDCLSLLCEDGAKPNVLNLAFTPLACPADPATDPYNSQTQETCFGGLPTVEPVRIRARSPGGDLWFDSIADQGGDGLVSVGENFVVSQAPKNFKGGNMVFEILDPNVTSPVCNNDGSGAGCLQRIEFHISCSQPLNIADQFGSIEIVGGLQQK